MGNQQRQPTQDPRGLQWMIHWAAAYDFVHSAEQGKK